MGDSFIKGGFTPDSWMARYARHFEALGWTPYQAESAALNAWEASDDDADPDETACADISYLAEDRQ